MAKADGPGSLRAASLPTFAPFLILSSLFLMILGSVFPYFRAFQSVEREDDMVSCNFIYKMCNFWAFLLEVADPRVREIADSSWQEDPLWNRITLLNLNFIFIYYLCVCARVCICHGVLVEVEDIFLSCFSLSTFESFLGFELRSPGLHGRWLSLMLSHLGIPLLNFFLSSLMYMKTPYFVFCCPCWFKCSLNSWGTLSHC